MLTLSALALLITPLQGVQVSLPIASPPRRLLINGSMVSAPESPGVPLKLRGFNFWPALDQPITSLDTVVTTLLPNTNFARLVMVHWKDAKGVVKRGADCYAPHAITTGFLKPACVAQFDSTVAWTTGAGIWTVIAVRSKGGDDHSPIWDNTTLANQYAEMLSFIAGRYANVSNIAGYEVLAEPRITDASRIHALQVTACETVWKQDARAACFIGAGKFYNRYNLNASYIIKDKPVIYAANYLTPKKWTNNALKPGDTPFPPGFAYPGSKIKCGDLVAQKEIAHVCPNGDRNAEITFNKDFLRALAQQLFDFQREFNVPLWVDQWGITGSVKGGNTSVQTYMEDVLSLWEEEGYDFMWTQWIWRSYYTTNCSGYSVVCTAGHQSAAGGSTCDTQWYPQVNVMKPLSKYLGGDGGGSGGPLPHQPAPSPLCKCIGEAKSLCPSGPASACKSCVWKHHSDLEADGCDWNEDHTAIVEGACGA